MSKQVVTIGYLKTFVNGILTVSTDKEDSYCPTYSELTGGVLVTNYKADTNPTKTTNGIKVNGCTVTTTSTSYASNQLVIRQDLQLLYQQLQSITVAASPTTISCCGGSSTLSTTAYFKLLTKSEGGTTTADTSTSASVTATYSDEKTFTTIDSNKITFTKNSVDTSTCTSAAARSTTVTGSYKYSGVTKTNTVDITQSKNTIDSTWTNTSTSTYSISVSPGSMSFDSGGGTKSYSVTRYYTQYQKKYDDCGTAVCSNSFNTSSTVTPDDYETSGDFTCTSSSVSIDTNSGSARSGTLTVTYDGYTDTCSLSQGASQAGTSYGDPYNYDYYLSVYTSSGKISCDGGDATFTAYYVTTWDYDWFEKNDAGEITNSGTSTGSSSTNVTSSAEWSTTVGSVTNGKLTLGSYNADERRTATVTATYNDYSDNDYVYQESCYDEPEDTGGTSCMNVKYTVESGINCTVYFKTTNGTQQAQHSVSKTGDQELCNIAEETEIVVSCSDTGVTLTGDVSFTYQTGSDIYIGLNKKTNTGNTGSSEVCMDVVITNEDSCTGDLLIKNASGVKISEYGIDQGNAVTFCYTKGATVYISMRDSDGTTATLTDGGTSFTVVEGGTVYVNITCDSSGGGDDTGTTFDSYCVFEIKKDGQTSYSSSVTLEYAAASDAYANLTVNSKYYTAETSATEIGYTLSSDKTWVTVDNSTKKWTVANNTTYDSRSATITLTQTGGTCSKNCYIYINQAGKPNDYTFYFDLVGTGVQVPYGSGTYNTIKIVSTKNGSMFDSFTVSENCDWVTFGETSKGTSNYTLPFTVTQNTSTTNRTCNFSITQSESNKILNFLIEQEGKEDVYVFTDNTPSDNINRDKTNKGSSLLVTSTKNGNMFSSITVSESCDWVTFSNTFSSDGKYVLPFNVTENTGTTERSCTVTATQGTSNKQLTWTIKQSAEKEKPVVSQIFIRNNCPGTVNIEYTGPTGGKVYTSMTADASGSFNLPMTGQTDVQVSIPRDCYQQSQSNFIYVEFLDGDGNQLPINASGNTRDEGGGAIAFPNLMGTGSSESSICTTTAKYQACATILFQSYN